MPLSESSQLPILGVCLGLQSLCIAFGGQLKRLAVVKHGIISQVTHVGRDIFAGVEKVAAVQYHSLHVDMLRNNDEIEELAWTVDEGENGRVLMAARHRRRPYWAVQYHLESICTEGGGQNVSLAKHHSKLYPGPCSRTCAPIIWHRTCLYAVSQRHHCLFIARAVFVLEPRGGLSIAAHQGHSEEDSCNHTGICKEGWQRI